MPTGLLFLVLTGVTIAAGQTSVSQSCEDLLGRWEYVSPPSPLPGVVDISREADGRYMGRWQRIPKQEGEPSVATWLASCQQPAARWLILFGTRPAPSCKGELRERSMPKAIEFVCHMPDGTESLAGAAQRPS
jgi:hypothetical protein